MVRRVFTRLKNIILHSFGVQITLNPKPQTPIKLVQGAVQVVEPESVVSRQLPFLPKLTSAVHLSKRHKSSLWDPNDVCVRFRVFGFRDQGSGFRALRLGL